MKAIFNSFITLFFFLAASTVSYAGWDPQCLNDCFKTGHECKYCSYQCYSEDYQNLTPYVPETECPLKSYYRGLDR